jgi:molecular chaperone DnaK (HSP70)
MVMKLTRAKLESLVGDLIAKSMKPCGRPQGCGPVQG